MDKVEFDRIVDLVPKMYEKAASKVSTSFVQKTLKLLLALMERDRLPISVMQEVTRLLEAEVKRTKTKAGITAGFFFNRLDGKVREYLRPFMTVRISGSSIAHQISSRDSVVNRLEKELRDIRSIVATPDVEQKIKDLQTQVEAIQRNTDSIASVAVDAAEDLLKKFVVAEKKVFVIMPFRREMENVWLGAIKPACKDCNFASLRVDEINLSSLITDDIERYSTMANVVIVDITDNNPNVMFEFGWALAKNKKPIVICQGDETSKVPFDVRAIRYIPYENSWLGIEALRKRIKEYLQASEIQTPKGKKKKVAKTTKARASKEANTVK